MAPLCNVATKTCNKFAKNEKQQWCGRHVFQESNCVMAASTCHKFALAVLRATPAPKKSNGIVGNTMFYIFCWMVQHGQEMFYWARHLRRRLPFNHWCQRSVSLLMMGGRGRSQCLVETLLVTDNVVCLIIWLCVLIAADSCEYYLFIYYSFKKII